MKSDRMLVVATQLHGGGRSYRLCAIDRRLSSIGRGAELNFFGGTIDYRGASAERQKAPNESQRREYASYSDDRLVLQFKGFLYGAEANCIFITRREHFQYTCAVSHTSAAFLVAHAPVAIADIDAAPIPKVSIYGSVIVCCLLS